MGGAIRTVVIVGGGIGGLTTAIALRKLGIDAMVFERAADPKALGAGIVLTINGMRVLDELGLKGEVCVRGNPLTLIALSDEKGKHLTEIDLLRVGARWQTTGIAIRRGDLHAILETALGASGVRYGHEFQEYKQEGGRVVAQFKGGQNAEGDLLAGCDGLHSTVRRQMFGAPSLRYSGQTCWRGIAAGDAEQLTQRQLSHFVEYWGGGYRFGAVPLAQDRVYWFVTRMQQAGAFDEPPAVLERLLTVFRTWHPSANACLRATPPDEIVQHDLYDIPPSNRWGTDRAILLGDAIHPTTPNLGQGAGMAIESAAVLARALAGCSDLGAALATYCRLRQPRTRAITNESRSVAKLSSWSNPFAQTLRNWTMRRAPSSLVERRAQRLLGYSIHGAE